MKEEVIDENELKLLDYKLRIFNSLKVFISKIELFKSDEELIEVCNYLFNCLYIYFDVDETNRNNFLFNIIILCCFPFELETAKNTLILLNLIDINIIIDGKNIKDFDINNLQSNTEIYLKDKNIKVLCKDINWNLDANDFIYLLNNEYFMLLFRFPKLSKINYLFIDEDIKQNYENLFKKIMKSQSMKDAMNVDDDAKQFKYLFNNDELLNEIENNCYYVPLPAKNYSGLSDRLSFTIYINSVINQSNYKQIFIDIHHIIKSKCHEIKHISRIYFCIHNQKIPLKTPKISKNGFLKKNKKIRFKNELIKSIYYSKEVQLNEIENLDYGDILEFALNGTKQDVFFIKNSLFCLNESSWELETKKFIKTYFKCCLDKIFIFKNNNSPFINSVIKYFSLQTNILTFNDANTTKSSSKVSSENLNENLNINAYFVHPITSHINFRK